MKTEKLTYLLFFIGCLACLVLAINFTPKYKQEPNTVLHGNSKSVPAFSAVEIDTSTVSGEDIDFYYIGNIPTDTGTYNHSEIQVQELGENWIYQHQIEPRYLNND